MTFDCGGTVGRNVSVFHPIVPLSLCEVEVYSNWEHPENIFPQRPPSVGKKKERVHLYDYGTTAPTVQIFVH